jgi:hypothetical protein
MAAHPMAILDKIQKGTIEPEHIRHLEAMYPELADHLQKKVTEKILKAQLKGEKPKHSVRQGLSMFLGAPLSSEMSPQNIMAAQATFRSSAQGPGGSGPTKPPTPKAGALSKFAQGYLTADEAAAGRQQKQ